MFNRGWVSPKKLCSGNLSIGFNVDGKLLIIEVVCIAIMVY